MVRLGEVRFKKRNMASRVLRRVEGREVGGEVEGKVNEGVLSRTDGGWEGRRIGRRGPMGLGRSGKVCFWTVRSIPGSLPYT